VAGHRLRRKTRFLNRLKQISQFSHRHQIFLFRFIGIYDLLSPSRLDQRGASRSSRTLRRDAVGVSMLQRGFTRADEQLDAHGQVAWS